MNAVVVSTFRRPFHTRLCLESICRAQRWHRWADKIYIGIPCNGHEFPKVIDEAYGVIDRNQDIPLEICAEVCESNPVAASKYLLDHAFMDYKDMGMVLYVEDDAYLSPDAFLMLEFVQHFEYDSLLGCCLYHETIPEQYVREGRPEGPNRRLLHLSNGLNTCGGTAFLRKPYLEILSPNWNCKIIEPKGFDYSAHYLMYIHELFMVWPDLSRSMNCGFEVGAISQANWARYFGRSIWTQTKDAVRDYTEFCLEVTNRETQLVREEWMNGELLYRGSHNLPLCP